VRRTGAPWPPPTVHGGSRFTDLAHIAARAHGVIAPTDTHDGYAHRCVTAKTSSNCATRIRDARPTFTRSGRATGPAPNRAAQLRPRDRGANAARRTTSRRPHRRTTIVELKTGHLTEAHQFHDLIDQTLTYTLLHRSAATRSPQPSCTSPATTSSARYPVEPLTTELAGEPIDTITGGRHLAMLIQTEQLP